MTAYRSFGTRNRSTPQSEPIHGREDMVKNSAGGYVWEVDQWTKLERFLILGTEGGTYYIKEKELTKQNAENVIACVKADGLRAVSMIREISESGRAVRNDPALFALAVAFSFGDEITKHAAKEALPAVARIGTHLFHFAQYAEQFRGWGRALKSAVANWYDNSQRDLAYQLVKYRQRDGWSHADLLRLTHPKAHPDLYSWVLRDFPKHTEAKIEEGKYRIIDGFTKIQEPGVGKTYAATLIREYRLPREAVPTELLNEKEIWAALLEVDMGPEAMIRNLGNMAKVGLLTPLSDASKLVTDKLANTELMRRARVHPVKILAGLKVYGQGHGVRGDGKWESVAQINDALNDAFYASFGFIEPSGKNTMLALDVSASMSSGIMGIDYLACNEGAAVMAMVTARTEPNYMICAFDQRIRDLSVSANENLASVMKKVKDINGGGTDTSIPPMFAKEKGLPIDVFCVYTDNETWAGQAHTSQRLKDYRQFSGRPAKLATVAMVSNGFTIADPKDPGMMDFVGFDLNTPAAIAAFSR